MSFSTHDNRLIYRYDAETLHIEPWGNNALRVRATQAHEMSQENWALQMPITSSNPQIEIKEGQGATVQNGEIKANLSARGKLVVSNAAGKVLLEEYVRNRHDVLDPKCSSLSIEAREFRPTLGGSEYQLTARFESQDPKEKIYGMGQYQHPFLDLKGMDLELAQRNSQASVPFAVSSCGYGFLWNHPGVGRATFGKFVMSFEAYATTMLDYWITAGDSPRQIVENYASVTGTVPMMPEYGLGFWQCKLRYQTQEELLQVAREYKKRDLPIDLVVVDFFHWPLQGEWKFDPTYWPDPDAMVKELQSLNIELMVSIWPTVDTRSENYDEMLASGYLIRTDRGHRIAMDFQGNTLHYDATNPRARSYLWSKAHQNYYSKGIRTFWLDEAEPEYSVYSFDNYRYHLGPNLKIGNIYPLCYAQTFYEGQTAAGQKNIVNLLRCAWAGSQRYGALVWSGDIASSWEAYRCQIVAGLNMGMAGIPWWTSDIGGFHGGDPKDEGFRELLVRWFQWATFCPVMRLHGDREPKQPKQGDTGGPECRSGAPNEVWSYGEEVEGVLVRYLRLRERLRGYIRGLMREAHEKGTPVMRTCSFEFPGDKVCWEVEDQYMFGDSYLVAPVLNPGQTERRVYLPAGRWSLLDGEGAFEGGKYVDVKCPLETMPVFVRG